MDKVKPHCPICSSDVSDSRVTCASCQIIHCSACWEYNGSQCAIYGCSKAFLIPSPTLIETPRARLALFNTYLETIFSLSRIFLVVALLLIVGSQTFVRDNSVQTTVNSGQSIFSDYNELDYFPLSGAFGNFDLYKKTSLVQFRIPAKSRDRISILISGYFRYEIPDRYTGINRDSLYLRNSFEQELVEHFAQIIREESTKIYLFNNEYKMSLTSAVTRHMSQCVKARCYELEFTDIIDVQGYIDACVQP